MQFTSWYGVFAPAGTPPEIVEKLSAEIIKATKSPATRTKLEGAGLRVTGTTREEFARLLKEDIERWGRVVKATGFKAQE
jgi:tripartite-type tricarboxylate transporter receptor subunit TctC